MSFLQRAATAAGRFSAGHRPEKDVGTLRFAHPTPNVNWQIVGWAKAHSLRRAHADRRLETRVRFAFPILHLIIQFAV